MKTTARPSAFSCAMMRKRSSISLRDSAAVGSSMMMTEASWLSARVISTMCFWATDSCFSFASDGKSASMRRSSAEVLLRIRSQSTRPAAVTGMWPMKIFSATLNSSNITVS